MVRIADRGRLICSTGAVDRERNGFMSPVQRRHSEGIDLDVTGPEGLGSAVGNPIGIGPVGSDNEVSEISGGRGNRRLERRLALIGIENRQLPGRGQIAVRTNTGIAGHIVDNGIADDGRVIDAVDGERHLLAGAVESGHRKRLDLNLTGSEVLYGAVRDPIGVVTVGRDRKRAERARCCDDGRLE